MADPISVTPGQVISWEILNKIGSQHGSPAEPKSILKVERKALTQDQKNAISDAGGDPEVEENPVYRYYFEDNSWVDARAAATGRKDPGTGRVMDTFTVVDYQRSPEFTQTNKPANKPTTPHIEGTPQPGGGYDNTQPIQVHRDENQQQVGPGEPLTAPQRQQWERDKNANAGLGAKTDAEIATETTAATAAGKPKAGAAYQNAQGQWVQPITDAQGNVTGTQPVPAGAEPKQPSTPVAAPPTQKWIAERKADGTITSSLNPNYKPPSQITKDPETGQYVEITEDAEGKPIVRPVTNQTTIKPADLPVLQAKYGEISQGLGALAADLNGRFSRGEITEKQRTDAFTAAHQQAATQIAEINSILETSRAAWGQEIQQRGQTLADTQGRRAFAGDVLQNALSTGNQIALSAGPGHGAAIAGGVSALMDIGQRYAEGMGGFKESPEVSMPTSVRQAQGVGLPGFPMPASAASPASPASAAGLGISDTTDAGGVPRVMTPSSATNAPQAAIPGMNPMISQMAAQLQGGGVFSGSPVAAGGMGVYDPLAEAQRMLATRASGQSDPSWEEAVRRASQDAASRSGGQPGYQRFMS